MTEDNDQHEDFRPRFAQAWLASAKFHELLLRNHTHMFALLAALNGIVVLQEIVDTGWLSWVFLAINGSLCGFMTALCLESRKRWRKVAHYREQLEPMLQIWLKGEGVTQAQWDSMYEQLEATSEDIRRDS